MGPHIVPTSLRFIGLGGAVGALTTGLAGLGNTVGGAGLSRLILNGLRCSRSSRSKGVNLPGGKPDEAIFVAWGMGAGRRMGAGAGWKLGKEPRCKGVIFALLVLPGVRGFSGFSVGAAGVTGLADEELLLDSFNTLLTRARVSAVRERASFC